MAKEEDYTKEDWKAIQEAALSGDEEGNMDMHLLLAAAVASIKYVSQGEMAGKIKALVGPLSTRSLDRVAVLINAIEDRELIEEEDFAQHEGDVRHIGQALEAILATAQEQFNELQQALQVARDEVVHLSNNTD